MFKRSLIFCCLAIFFLNCYEVKAQRNADVLWYAKPAINFNEALPLGNGRMGAMVYGRAQSEYISLNEQTLWSGSPDIKWNNPVAKKYLPLVREAALNGEYKKADSLCKFMQGPYTESYLPMADLHINYKNIYDSAEYKRILNLDSAIAITTFQSNNIRYKRTVFASFPDKVIVIRHEADKKASLSFDVMLSSKLHYSVTTVNENEIILKGKAPKHVEPAYLWKIQGDAAMQYASDSTGEGMTFEVHLKIINEGGTINANDSSLHVANANAVTILITSATSFNGYDVSPVKHGKKPSLIAEAAMNKASAKSYSVLLSNHLNDYKPLYKRVSYDFGKAQNDNLPTDERLQKMPSSFDPGLLSTIVQFGRYLLIACSRPGGQPANLKGLWNEKLRPEYASNWCIDHDAQMFYYPVETNNLSEMHEPFLQLIKELSQNGYQTAKVNYNMDGWCAHHNTDIWRKSSPVGNWGEGNPHWANWNMSGAWLCEHYFEHYLFTLDKNFLRNSAYPIMQGAAQFCLAWLIPDSNGKYLISVPSFSPENTFITADGDTAQTSVNTTSNIELIKDLFSNIIKTANILHIKNSFIDSIRNAYKKLAPYPIGKNGNLLEWSQDWRSTDPAHRHLSHMYAVFPGSEISPLITPQLAEAAKKALSLRAKTNGSWGFAWKAACWARLYEGDSAMQTLRYQLRYVSATAATPVNNLGLYPNLFNSEVPGVILNGNTCITAAVTEMLLQSQTGIIDLLPALPTALRQGSVKGLCARGGFVINIDWFDNQLTTANVFAKTNSACKINLKKHYKIYLNNILVPLKDLGNGIVSFQAIKGKNYIIKK
ncbi:MAG: glycoside hydrolase family 95 protein [Ferruginibacter sp.]